MSSIVQKMRSTIWIDAAGVAVSLVAAVAAYYLGIAPLLEQRRVAEVEQQRLAARHDQAADIQGSIYQMNARLHDLRKRLDGTNMSLSPAHMVNSRVADLTALLAGCSLAVDDVTIGETAKGPHCETVPIQISGKGGYVQCAQFLHSLSQRLPDMHVACLDLKRSPTGRQEEHTFRFDLVWYTSSS